MVLRSPPDHGVTVRVELSSWSFMMPWSSRLGGADPDGVALGDADSDADGLADGVVSAMSGGPSGRLFAHASPITGPTINATARAPPAMARLRRRRRTVATAAAAPAGRMYPATSWRT